MTPAADLASVLIDAARQSVFSLFCFLNCRVGCGPATTTLLIEGFAASIALDIHLQDRGVMDESIDGRERHGLVREDLAPFADWLVGRDQYVRIPTKSPGYNGILAPGIPE